MDFEFPSLALLRPLDLLHHFFNTSLLLSLTCLPRRSLSWFPVSLILLLLLLLVPLDLRPETKCAGHSCLALRRCLSWAPDFVGPPCLEEIEFTGPGFVVSGQQQCATPESAAQIGHHLLTSGTGSTQSCVQKAWRGPPSSRARLGTGAASAPCPTLSPSHRVSQVRLRPDLPAGSRNH